MDAPTNDISVAFMVGNIQVKHRFPIHLLEKYPNSSIALGYKDNPSQEVILQDMTVNEYIDMLAVLMGKTALSECDERTNHLLDVHGFVNKLEYMFAAPLKQYRQDLLKRVRPFHTHDTNVFFCATEPEYWQCKLAFNNDKDVVPIQVITLGNQPLFCSCECGIPIINSIASGYPKTREECVPNGIEISVLMSLMELIIEYRTQIGRGLDPIVYIQKECSIQRGDMIDMMDVPDDAWGSHSRDCCDEGEDECCYKPPPTPCKCCSLLKCDCSHKLFQSQIEAINSTNEVIYCASMFELFGRTLMTIPSRKNIEIKEPLLVSTLIEAQKQQLRIILCQLDWSVATNVKRTTVYGPAMAMKLDMYLGFVCII